MHLPGTHWRREAVRDVIKSCLQAPAQTQFEWPDWDSCFAYWMQPGQFKGWQTGVPSLNSTAYPGCRYAASETPGERKKPCGYSLRTTCLSLFWFVNHPKTYISLCSFPDVPALALLGTLLLSHALRQHGSGDTEELCFASLCPHLMPDPGAAHQPCIPAGLTCCQPCGLCPCQPESPIQ